MVLFESSERIIESIRNGNHKELERKTISLVRLKEKKIAACDRFRKMQIKNINQLYEYEVEDANAIYNVELKSIVKYKNYEYIFVLFQRSYNDLQDQLINDVILQKNKIQRKLQAYLSSDKDAVNKATATRSLRSTGIVDMPVLPTSSLANTSSNRSHRRVPNGSSIGGRDWPSLNQTISESSMRFPIHSSSLHYHYHSCHNFNKSGLPGDS